MSHSLTFRHKIGFLRLHARLLALWPLACGMLIAGVVVWAGWIISREKGELRERAYLTMAAQANTYSEQIDRTVGQLDYILLSLQFQWQENGGKLNLEKQSKAGLVPKTSEISIWLFDRDGFLVTTTNPYRTENKSIAERDYFRAHAAGRTDGLVISKVVRSILIGRDIIILSRRLDKPDGSFAGIITVTIEPAFLVSFVDKTSMRKDDFVSVRSADNDFIVATTRAGLQWQTQNLISNPVMNGSTGMQYRFAHQYRDSKARLVAWNTSKKYPVIVSVGLAEANLLAEYEPRYREIVLIALSVSTLLLLVAMAGLRRSIARAGQMQYTREIHDAYRVATENAKEGFYMLRAIYGPDNEIFDFLIEDCNERGAMYREVTREALIGKTVIATLPAVFHDQLLNAFRQAMATGFVEEEIRIRSTGEAGLRWLQMRAVRAEVGVAVTLRDITETKTHQKALEDMANTDPVTSLPNRHWLTHYLPGAIESARKRGKLLMVMFVDLDDFKNINDTVGHAAGDALLKAAASRLKAVIDPNDRVVRLGGDEFTIVGQSAQSREEIALVAERVIDALSTPYAGGSITRPHVVRASVGISIYPEDGSDGETLLKLADIAMYAAKAGGKGTYRFFDPSLERRLVTRLTREAELKLAIERRELVLHYQARVKANTGEISSMEALVRWRHPEAGLIPPNEFIPMAEKTGLIVPLGTEVIRMTCEQLALWKEQGLPVVPISVNVSAQQIDTGTVSAVLAEALIASGLDSSLLEVEVTESATVTEAGVAASELVAIQKSGIKVYVDDFGTGYSCLAQLKQLDMDGLKIDRAFTSQLLNGRTDAALFEVIVAMAHALDMRVVAEGVETAEQLAALQSLGCEEVQGYYISKPVPAVAAAQLLQKRFLFPCARLGV